MKARYWLLSLLILALFVFPSCTCEEWVSEYGGPYMVHGTWEMTLREIAPELPVSSQLVGLIAPGLDGGYLEDLRPRR